MAIISFAPNGVAVISLGVRILSTDEDAEFPVSIIFDNS